MNYPRRRAAGYRKGKISIAPRGGELNPLSAFGGLNFEDFIIHRQLAARYFIF